MDIWARETSSWYRYLKNNDKKGLKRKKRKKKQTNKCDNFRPTTFGHSRNEFIRTDKKVLGANVEMNYWMNKRSQLTPLVYAYGKYCCFYH